MSSAALRRHGADLAWSLWTELGVAGVVRNHSATAVDLEPLLAITPVLAADDPRLLEQVLSWCDSHADRVNATRLSSLVQALPRVARSRFEEFASTVNAVAGTKWPAAGEPWTPLPRLRSVPLPLEREALVRLRARALCGVGTRADVLCDLVSRPRAWCTASALAEHGHSKRNTARVLAEFESARIVIRQASGNVLRYRPSQPAALAIVLGGVPAAHPDWIQIFRLTLLLLDLSSLDVVPAPVRRVEANTRREAIAPIAERLWLDTPPSTRGEPEAWQALVDWGVAQVSELAAGTSPALGVAAVRGAELPGGTEAWVWLADAAPGQDHVAALLRRPGDAASGVTCATVTPIEDGWTAYQLIFSPSLSAPALRAKVEHLVAPLKVAWRLVDSTS